MSGWIEYDSNNSGGSWWLKDEDWEALEDAGWRVGWIMVTEKTYSGKKYLSAESGRWYADTREKAFGPLPSPGALLESDETVIATATTFAEAVALREKFGGYLGNALAVSAIKEGESATELVAEFERIAGQNASDEGCNCCGPPHSFEWHDDDGTTSYGRPEVVETRLAWS